MGMQPTLRRAFITEIAVSSLIALIAAVFVLADGDDVGAISFYRDLGGADSPVTLFVWN